MTSKPIQIQRVDSLNQPVQEVEALIRERAYDRFLQRGGKHGNDQEDWHIAASETIVLPPLTLSETESQVTVMFSVPGLDARDIEVLVTERAILIRGAGQSDIQGAVRIREFSPRQIFRVVELPQPIDPSSLRAEFQNGALRLTASLSSSVHSYQARSA